ncbi:hypothetical protein DFH05DRAFT_1510426, partial [Lentinula detonsa]
MRFLLHVWSLTFFTFLPNRCKFRTYFQCPSRSFPNTQYFLLDNMRTILSGLFSSTGIPLAHLNKRCSVYTHPIFWITKICRLVNS